ncbi:methionine synthase [Antrihabitans sp. NCIMB 15449]|uniref:Methionine synthase n=1 Tax=Antrihabitans spumae TaxID=3373370 RepID=A0ABW7JRH5_9NOCA|nr:methionine synthase [Antrihabitans stalagmiti]
MTDSSGSVPLGGIATGIGSWPGTDPREAATIVVGELGDLPHIVELPARGVGADMIGRAGALLIDLHFDTTTRGYRLTARQGNAARRSSVFLRDDLDALEEAWGTAGFNGLGKTVKVQTCGPLTLAAEVELANGHRVITDSGALRDFSESLAEGLSQHVAEVARRLDAKVLVQIDEPLLSDVLNGSLRGVTSMDSIGAMPAPDALNFLDTVIDAANAPVLVHNCASSPPLELLRRSHASYVGIDVAQLEPADLDGIGELLEAGKGVALGLVPSTDTPAVRKWRDLAEPALQLVDRLGFPRATLGSKVIVTPSCGLAGASDAWARKALRLSTEVARAFAEEPESL